MHPVLAAAAAGDNAALAELLAADPTAVVHVRDAETQGSPLHYAARGGHLATVQQLVTTHRHPWNEVDARHETAAEWARARGHAHVWDWLRDEGVRAEMLLALLESRDDDADDDDDDAGGRAKGKAAAAYLRKKLVYTDGLLVDEDGNGVMMGWETPLMKRHAEVIAPAPGLSVLNVGFGLGIIDSFLQERAPRKHTIIEAHPDVYAKMIADGWDKKPNVRILFGRWQDVADQLEAYDGVFFDTFGEDYDALREFHELLPNILNQEGVYSYFNGLAGSNPFFHEVACAVCDADLRELGIETQTEQIEMGTLGDDVWAGVARKYWTLPIYNLPTCRFIDE
ncbi:hypothetical protein HDU84_004948 [Entophlyctis sp. JEL0112]|nr:hypothetical protein HDU84_004948 [Entophlyctis sp. JEL0112]